MARLEIQSIGIDPVTQMPVVLLKALGRGRFFPLRVGLFEANAIALELEGIPTPRPMTHDLLKNTILAMGGTVNRVAFTDLRENTYFATIYIEMDGREITLDSRPSDAISLALRCRAPICIDDELLERMDTFASIQSCYESMKPRSPEG